MSYPVFIWNVLCREPKGKEEISTVHVFSLPFRLDIGEVSTFQCVDKGDLFDVWVYNEVASYNVDDMWEKSGGNLAMLTSKVLIQYKNAKISDSGFSAVVSSVKSNRRETSALEPIHNADRSPVIINRVLSACNAVSPFFFQGIAIKTITEFDLTFGNLHLATDVIVAEAGFSLSREQAECILKSYPVRLKYSKWSSAGGIPSLEDIKEAQRVLNNSGQMLFYELLFDAKSKEMQGDVRGALMQASAALESLIWVVLDINLGARFFAAKDNLHEESEKRLLSDKNIREVISEFGKELGLTLLVETVPYLFLTSAERPKPSEIDKVVKAISWRNKLVHSKKTKSGEYFWREKYDFGKHYSDLYGFVFKLGSFVRKKVMV